ncbi:MAG: indole-3-glycerol phosphate synthase TrpC [Chloroflexi bacterium]|nr:indole-3-glycerol phosphate synthase TrpC [Chloroflexota bacterium]
MRFTRTDTVLDRILEHKVDEITACKARVSQAELASRLDSAPPPRDMLSALRRNTVALIAEVKRASPSKGVLVEDFDPLALGTTYAANGAAAISVLTDECFFQGHLDYLTQVRAAVKVPVLRKEFVIDPYQVIEGRVAGADAVLLIMAALDDAQLADLHAAITDLGMVPLVEVHNAAELDRALRLEPKLLGVNNRDLKTFNVDLATTQRLASQVPAGVTLVAESGIRHGADVQQMGAMGAHAVLVGETLVKANDVAAMVRELSCQPRETTP